MESRDDSRLDIILNTSSEDIRNQSYDNVRPNTKDSLKKTFSNWEEFLAFRVSPTYHLANIENTHYAKA